MDLITSSPATVLALHHGYRVPGGEEVAADQFAILAEHHLGETVRWIRRDSTELSAGAAARGLLQGGTDSRKITDAIRTSGADLVHAHNLFPTFGPAALRAARNAGAAVVVHLHNYRLVCAVATNVRDGQDCTECRAGWPTPGLRHRCRGSLPEATAYAAALPRWHKPVIELADVIVVPSVAARIRLLDLGLALPADRVHVIGGAAPHVASRSTASTGRYALAVTRLAPEKDLRTAIDACHRAGLPLVIAGDGPERAALQRYAGRVSDGVAVTAAATTAAVAPVAPEAPAAPEAAGTPEESADATAHGGSSDADAPAGGDGPVVPPPREFPLHHNPFLSPVSGPPSKPPPRAGAGPLADGPVEDEGGATSGAHGEPGFSSPAPGAGAPAAERAGIGAVE